MVLVVLVSAEDDERDVAVEAGVESVVSASDDPETELTVVAGVVELADLRSGSFSVVVSAVEVS